MGQVENKESIIEINSKDLENNKVPIIDILDKSKTSFISLNIKQNNEIKTKFKRKRKIDFEYVDSFIDFEDKEESIKFLSNDISKYNKYFREELIRLEAQKEKYDKDKISDKLIEPPNKIRKDLEKNLFIKFEDSNGFVSYSIIDQRKESKRLKSDKFSKLNNRKIDFEKLNELDKLQKEFDKEKLSFNDPDFLNNLNLLIHKYENKSFDHCKQFFLSKK